MHASTQARLILESVQGPLRPVSSILANAQKSPSAPQVVTKDTRESCVAHDSAGSYSKCAPRKHHPPQPEDVPATKRHRPSSANDRLRTRSAPLTRLSSPVIPGLRSHSTPKATLRQRLVIDCVEVVPLREILRRQGSKAERDKKRKRQRKDDSGYHVPETPLVPRMTRELFERDEIGEIQEASVTSHLTGTNCSRSSRNPRHSSATRLDAFAYT
jgi:hypothetical protein